MSRRLPIRNVFRRANMVGGFSWSVGFRASGEGGVGAGAGSSEFTTSGRSSWGEDKPALLQGPCHAAAQGNGGVGIALCKELPGIFLAICTRSPRTPYRTVGIPSPADGVARKERIA